MSSAWNGHLPKRSLQEAARTPNLGHGSNHWPLGEQGEHFKDGILNSEAFDAFNNKRALLAARSG